MNIKLEDIVDTMVKAGAGETSFPNRNKGAVGIIGGDSGWNQEEMTDRHVRVT